ncbi:hypothetical protein [Aureimonas jatrophae]|uniref:Uncharacterized protein n=1 Tax=Aureimonas jatrophae TaxID=1166073 RepID=A0A1H0CKD8_9HYPH|nr:hypothetical protein [Aureimonas jatrophae]MBB3949272.1 putative nucleic acid-binding Zn-ribbon protein [Aureimonas jatrophae]SDN58315.1 hypothetical protein SAMN05192530_101348 [Aureimonas jatrophae]
MIGTLLVFALGFMAAALIALLFAPFLWHKAQRLARRRFDAEIPANVREMQGEIDAVRARAAFDLRREEMRATEALGRATTERAEAGRIVLENGTLRARQAELERDLAEVGARFEAIEQTLAATRLERDDIARDRQALGEAFERRGSELEALHGRHAAGQERLAAMQDRLGHLERRLAELERPAADPAVLPVVDGAQPTAPSRPAIEPEAAQPTTPAPEPATATPLTGGERLRAAIAAGVGARAPATRAENAEIRERISDLAARILRRQVDAEGPTSPIAGILAPDAADEPEAGAPPSLAARVRALAAQGDAPSASVPEPSPAADETSPKGSAARKDGAGRSRRRSRR